MEVKAISSANALNFEGKAQKHNTKHRPVNNNNHSQVTSNDGGKAMRNMMLGLMALGATAGTLASCEKDVFAEANSSSSSSSSATANAHIEIGGGCDHHDTITIIDKDTIITTIPEYIYVKDYPFNIGDSLIAQGQNIGIPIDGPVPDGTGQDSVVYVGSKAHNRYDDKFYESFVDSVGTNKRTLAVVTKVIDKYNDKTYYMKSEINDVPGKGIKITRYVADTAKKPDDDEQYLWNYAGYEVRSNGRDGKQNIRSIFDNNNDLVYRGNYEKGQNEGTFLYGSIIIDEETGEPVYDEDGNIEFAQYDFDQSVIYSDYATRSHDYKHPGWKYEE